MREAKEIIEKRKAFDGINRNVKGKSWTCLFPGCPEPSINSHLLQRNGVLSNLVENGKLYELVSCNAFELAFGNIRIRLVGNHEALSEPLFCDEHDRSVFLPIESSSADWTHYSNQLLFAYRSTCSELRKKQRQLEVASRLERSNILSSSWAQAKGPLLAAGMQMGVRDIQRFKVDLESDILNGTRHFHFATHNYHLIEACASAIFSPMVNPVLAGYQEEPLSTVFINLAPSKGRLWAIVGHHKHHADEWTRSHVQAWSNTDVGSVQQRITDLFASRLETWCMSPRLYRGIAAGRVRDLLQYWNDHNDDHLATQQVPFNLFA